MNDNQAKGIIDECISVTGFSDYLGTYTELGGGELNDSYLLDGKVDKVVLRIARHLGHASLEREARALKLLDDVDAVPKLIFFDTTKLVDGKNFILEQYQPGQQAERLSTEQFRSLGTLLAKVHKIQNDEYCQKPWDLTLKNCHRFGDEPYLLNHPDVRLRWHFRALHKKSKTFDDYPVKQSLRHCDATPSNTLVNGPNVSLIDWELSGFGHPMSDFATGYWTDMDLNNGKWRQQLRPHERQALFDGYTAAGGDLDEDAVLFYELIDKLSTATYLYWRLHVSSWNAKDDMKSQYEIDYEKILQSLESELMALRLRP